MKLATLLEIISQPDNPQFDTALAQLHEHVQTLGTAPLSQPEASALLGTVEATIMALQTLQTSTAVELAKLRTQLAAQGAYGKV